MNQPDPNARLIHEEQRENKPRVPLWAFCVLGIILIAALVYRFG